MSLERCWDRVGIHVSGSGHHALTSLCAATSIGMISHMSYASDRMFRLIVFSTTLVAFPVALAIALFSSCDIRQRTDKQACRSGASERCLALGTFYESKSAGIIGFAMSNSATAAHYYGLGCKPGSSAACERLGHIVFHGLESVKDAGYSYADGVDALAQACVDESAQACSELNESFTDPRSVDIAEEHAARFFLDACNKRGNAEGCYQFGLFMTAPHGVVAADPVLAKQYFAKACNKGLQPACTK